MQEVKKLQKRCYGMRKSKDIITQPQHWEKPRKERLALPQNEEQFKVYTMPFL